MLRKSGFLTCICVPLALAAVPAHGASLPFTATLNVGISTLPAATFHASGTAVSDGFGQKFTVPLNAFVGTVVFSSGLFTGVPQISGLKVTATGNVSGSFLPSFSPPAIHPTHVGLAGSGVGGLMQIKGAAGVNVLLFFSLAIPLTKLGLGSTATAYLGAVKITPVATQWTTGKAYVRGITTDVHLSNSASLMDVTGVTVTRTGSDSRTAGGRGQVTLVSPVKAITSVAGSLPVFATVVVNFIPEPGTALLLGAGVVGLAALGRRRRRA